MNELISVIIPIYNVEQYLPRCLDSVTRQSYENLEIILVDDGSTDRSPAIMQQYAERDSRILQIHKRNGGMSDARNAALDICRGSYVTCLDSDDWVAPQYVETLYRNLKEHDADISIAGYAKVWDSSPRSAKAQKKIVLKEYTPVAAISEMWYQRQIGVQPWGKLYSAKLFDSIRYPYGKLYEDLATTHLLLWRANKIIYSSETLYYYFQRQGSIMYRQFDQRNMDRICASTDLLNWAEKNCKELVPAAQTRLFVSSLQVLRELPLSREYTEEIAIVKNNLRRYRKAVYQNKAAKKSVRIMAFGAAMDIRLLKKSGYLYKMIRR